MIIAAMLMTNFAFSNQEVGESKGTSSDDSVTYASVQFNIERADVEFLDVWVEGVEGDFNSISLIDQRGKSIFYQFVQTHDNHFKIDLTNLSNGKYYVKLNMGSEIRMKAILIEK